MPVANAQVADVLRRYATVLALEGADRFKVKAYRRAADTLDGLAEDVVRVRGRGESLTQFPGIGAGIAAAIEEILATGGSTRLQQKRSALSPELVELADYPGLDPKIVSRAYRKLGIDRVAQLREHLQSGTLREALGSRIEMQIRRGLDPRPRMLWWAAAKLVPGLEARLQSIAGVDRVATVGSFRRRCDTVGDLNVLVGGDRAEAVWKGLTEFGEANVVDRRKSERSFRLSSGLQVRLRWVPTTAWGIGLAETTGSAAHWQALRKRAAKKRLSLSARSLGRKAAADEAALYDRLGLTYVEPELREGRGEIAAAAGDALPRLVRADDLQGDLHMHTTASDGANTIEQMAAAARERGYRYIAITDHSQSLTITNGLSERRLLAQIRRIDRLNAKLDGIVILKSAEVDIREDGSLDYSDAVLKELDLTICSIHSRFALDERRQTERILRAMDNRYFTILGHATGRLLLRREGYGLDVERVLRHARDVGCFAEINSSPNRLDLSDEHARAAKDLGVKIAVNTDAHDIGELGFITAGINQARRAWLEPRDVLNCLPLAKLLKLVRR